MSCSLIQHRSQEMLLFCANSAFVEEVLSHNGMNHHSLRWECIKHLVFLKWPEQLCKQTLSQGTVHPGREQPLALAVRVAQSGFWITLCSELKITIRSSGLKQRLFQSSCNSSSCCLPQSLPTSIWCLLVSWSAERSSGAGQVWVRVLLHKTSTCVCCLCFSTLLKLVLVASFLCSMHCLTSLYWIMKELKS